MTTQTLGGSGRLSASQRMLGLLAVLFVGSGCSALIYEVVWLQSLQLVIGSSAVSLGVLLGTFMGGMCLGSFLLPRVVSASRHPLRVYALIELGIGVIGIALLFGMPYVDRLYLAHVGHGFANILIRGAVCAMCLLPPTILMGATLPAIARWVEATPEGVSWLGFFYGSNIAGAVFGCLLAGFYLLRVHDLVVATYVAAALNFTVASIGLLLAGRTVHVAQPPPAVVGGQCTLHGGDATSSNGAWIIYVVTGLSGLTALGAEVVWTRNLSLLLGGTVYTFSIILAVFLGGLGIGSSIGSVISRHSPGPRLALGVCQSFLIGAIAWAAYTLAESLPYWPIDPSLSKSPWPNFQLDLMRCVWVVLPGAILWGASFPLALASVVSRGQDPGRLVGGVYAANTVGAVLGALTFSMVLIPWLGTRGSQQVMIALAAVAVLLLLVATHWEIGALAFTMMGIVWLETLHHRRDWTVVGVIFVVLVLTLWARRKGSRRQRTEEGEPVTDPIGHPSSVCRTPEAGSRYLAWTALAMAPMVAVWLVWSVPAVPPGLIAYGRYLPTRTQVSETMYVGEGRNSMVAVTLLDDGVLSFHVSGKVEASTEHQDMRLQRMLGHISALVHPKPRSILVVGCGAGVTAGSFVLHPDVERIVLCEIEPLIPKIAALFFFKENYGVVHDPRVRIVYDDARHYILTTQEKFDVITSDPIHPWVKGSAALYTREYFELCKRHLNPGGVVTQWVPLYESSPDVVKSEMATFFAAFPGGMIWSNDIEGEGYDVVLLGQTEPTRIDLDGLQQRLERPDHQRVAESLSEVKFTSALDLLSTFAGQGPDLEPWLKGAQINTDRNLRLQYLAGMGLNANQCVSIYKEILSYRKFPDDLFVGTPQQRLRLKDALGNPQ